MCSLGKQAFLPGVKNREGGFSKQQRDLWGLKKALYFECSSRCIDPYICQGPLGLLQLKASTYCQMQIHSNRVEFLKNLSSSTRQLKYVQKQHFLMFFQKHYPHKNISHNFPFKYLDPLKRSQVRALRQLSGSPGSEAGNFSGGVPLDKSLLDSRTKQSH